MITCRELAELLIDFLSDQLPPERRDPIEQHLGRCAPCLAYLESYRSLVEVTRHLPVAAIPPRLEQRLQTILRESGKRQEATDSGADRLG
jgi:anti-sigma factor RsiW